MIRRGRFGTGLAVVLVAAAAACGGTGGDAPGPDVFPDAADVLAEVAEAWAGADLPSGEATPDAPGPLDLPADEGPGSDPAPAVCTGAPAGVAWPTAADSAFLRGPFVQSVLADRATVVWRTAVPGGQGCVRWEAAGTTHEACVDPDVRGQYQVTLTGLAPATDVPYRVTLAPDVQTAPLSFRTAPGDLRPVRMLVFGDAHNNVDTLSTWAASALADGTDLAIAMGDLTNGAQETEFDQFFQGLRPLLHRVPMWPIIGNHEDRGQAYFDAFVLPGAAPEPLAELYYSVRWGDVWLGLLDLVDIDIASFVGLDTPEITWLRQELSGPSAREARWRLLFVHEPPWTNGGEPCGTYQGEASLRKVLVPLAADYGVAALFSGHHHAWEHGSQDGVAIFVSGGGGGGLGPACPVPEGFPADWIPEVTKFHRLRVDAGCDQLVVEALDQQDGLIERVVVPHVDPKTPIEAP